MARRERTKHLIELGGLVQKAGLVALADDDRALLYGAFLDLALRLQGDDGAQSKLLYRRRGARAFATEAEEAARARLLQPTDRTGDGS
ncbi:MAG TPA: conjugal transfer protein TraD [Bradyrhizobium sp.]|nr:conjugal transfer protein TraD [Bradyrhizobium sp.]